MKNCAAEISEATTRANTGRATADAARNGEVTLTGTASNRWAKRYAEDLVARCRGVVDVQNRLQIENQQIGKASE